MCLYRLVCVYIVSLDYRFCRIAVNSWNPVLLRNSAYELAICLMQCLSTSASYCLTWIHMWYHRKLVARCKVVGATWCRIDSWSVHLINPQIQLSIVRLLRQYVDCWSVQLFPLIVLVNFCSVNNLLTNSKRVLIELSRYSAVHVRVWILYNYPLLANTFLKDCLLCWDDKC
jgi:hypothetical protein